MGCSDSRCAYETHPDLLEWKSEFDTLRLDESDITKLHNVFLKIISRDKCETKTPTIATTLKYLGFHGNVFMKRVFSMLDHEDQSGQIDFREFVLVIWNYCTHLDNFALFVFEVYDFDGNGKLDHEEYDEMMEDLYGTKNPSAEAFQTLKKKILRQKQLGNTGVSRHFFKEYCKFHPEVLKPAFRYQLTLKQRILPEKRWQRCKERRDDILGKHYLSLLKIEKHLLNDDFVYNPSDHSSDQHTTDDEREKSKPTVQSTMSLDDLVKQNSGRRMSRSGSMTGRRLSVSSTGSQGSVGDPSSSRRLSRQNSGSSLGSQGSTGSQGRRMSVGVDPSTQSGMSHGRNSSRRTFPADDRNAATSVSTKPISTPQGSSKRRNSIGASSVDSAPLTRSNVARQSSRKTFPPPDSMTSSIKEE